MPAGFRTIAAHRDGVAEIEVKKSRFLAVVRRCSTEDDARALVAEARLRHHSARHHCSAWVLGPRADVQRSNDDGEPSGTAGQPILDVLVGRGLSDVAAVVTRYFGGTLLGAGGLVRAYSHACAAALDDVSVVRRERLDRVSLTVAHDVAGRLESALRDAGFSVEETQYADAVTLTVATSDLRALRDHAAQALGADVELQPRGESWVDRAP